METVVKFKLMDGIVALYTNRQKVLIESEDLEDILNYVCDSYNNGFSVSKEVKELDGTQYITFVIV